MQDLQKCSPLLLEGAVPVVLMVAEKGWRIIAYVKALADVSEGKDAESNRDRLPQELEHWLGDRLSNQSLLPYWP